MEKEQVFLVAWLIRAKMRGFFATLRMTTKNK